MSGLQYMLNLWELMALSTWILREAVLRVSTISLSSNWVQPRKKGGILRCTPRGWRRSETLKPLSAITLSPFSSSAASPDSRVNSLLEMLPEYCGETRLTALDKVILIKPLKVLCSYSVRRSFVVPQGQTARQPLPL